MKYEKLRINRYTKNNSHFERYVILCSFIVKSVKSA